MALSFSLSLSLSRRNRLHHHHTQTLASRLAADRSSRKGTEAPALDRPSQPFLSGKGENASAPGLPAFLPLPTRPRTYMHTYTHTYIHTCSARAHTAQRASPSRIFGNSNVSTASPSPPLSRAQFTCPLFLLADNGLPLAPWLGSAFFFPALRRASLFCSHHAVRKPPSPLQGARPGRCCPLAAPPLRTCLTFSRGALLSLSPSPLTAALASMRERRDIIRPWRIPSNSSLYRSPCVCARINICAAAAYKMRDRTGSAAAGQTSGSAFRNSAPRARLRPNWAQETSYTRA